MATTSTSRSPAKRAPEVQKFLGQAKDALGLLRKEFRNSKVALEGRPRPLEPTIIDNLDNVTATDSEAIARSFESPDGCAYIVIKEPPRDSTVHPLFNLMEKLQGRLPLSFPLAHPLELHGESIRRFGPPDGTVRIYDLPKAMASGYREQGETAEAFDLHHDGLGSGGTVHAVVLYADQPPLWGGFTFFQNILRVACTLSEHDFEAFESLFLPDALTVVRPRGKGAIRVTSPCLYLNEEGRVQSMYRRASGEYVVSWNDKDPPLERARQFLDEHAQAFAPGSTFVNLAATGHALIIRNEAIAHGRTRFVDGAADEVRRRISRKWYMRTREDIVYKHVPGLRLNSRYTHLFPHLSSPTMLEGEWRYDASSRENIRWR